MDPSAAVVSFRGMDAWVGLMTDYPPKPGDAREVSCEGYARQSSHVDIPWYWRLLNRVLPRRWRRRECRIPSVQGFGVWDRPVGGQLLCVGRLGAFGEMVS